MLAVLDANCLIDAVEPSSHAHSSLQCVLQAHSNGRVNLAISLHTLAEITSPAARELAERLPLLPHFPIGAWTDQVATWNQLAGTWADAKRNQQIQLELVSVANAGSSLRDRGAYLDALAANADAFVTSDGAFAKSKPAGRILAHFGLEVLTPSSFVTRLGF